MKIDSVQKVITLRSDLHDAWDNYEFGVDPNVSFVFKDYAIFVAFAEQLSHYCLYQWKCRHQWQISPARSYPRCNSSAA